MKCAIIIYGLLTYLLLLIAAQHSRHCSTSCEFCSFAGCFKRQRGHIQYL